MDKREISELMETIDILRALARRGKEELVHFADYMIWWGAYIFVNLISSFLFNRGFWSETLFIPPMMAMAPRIGFLKSFLIWVWGYIAMYGAYWITHSALITVIVTILAFVLLIVVSYRLWYDKLGIEWVRFTISPYVGITWGVIWASIWYILALFPPEGNREILWFIYGSGMGLFVTGLLHRLFIYMGLYALFVLPLIMKFLPSVFLPAYSLIGLGMMVAGILVRRTNS